MSFLDKLKFWKRKESDAIGPPEAAAAQPVLIEAEPLLEALAEREAFNRQRAAETDSAHQKDKHHDRADEDSWIAAEIRKAMK